MNLQGIKILVSGGTGFIGSHLVKHLLEANAKVFVIVRKNSSTHRISDVLEKIQIIEGDLTNENSIFQALQIAQPEYIFNVAGVRKVDRDIRLLGPSLDINLNGVLNFFKGILKLDLPIKGFVQTGTFEEYGNGSVPFVETQREEPVSPYSASKLAATQFCQMLYKSLKYPVTVLRPCLMYGPHQEKDMFIPLLIDACLKNQDFPMTTGQQTRDIAYVEDIVEAYLKCIDCPGAVGEVINIGTGREIQIKELAKIIVNLTQSKTNLLFGSVPTRIAEVKRLFCNNLKAKQILNWEPRISLEEGLIKTIKWYRENM
jgi:nucleoside-diphosphate-sugar epimerase